jgi:hypothetical protein
MKWKSRYGEVSIEDMSDYYLNNVINFLEINEFQLMCTRIYGDVSGPGEECWADIQEEDCLQGKGRDIYDYMVKERELRALRREIKELKYIKEDLEFNNLPF